jgi:hypothetical protein
MIDIASLATLQTEIRDCIQNEEGVLTKLRADVRPLRSSTRRVLPQSTTAISLVGTDGGNNAIEYDPFMVQLVRVVDSSNNEFCLEAITPRTPIGRLDARHLDSAGHGQTALGRMMEVLGVRSLYDLSIVSRNRAEQKASWVQVYRELMEWAVLLDLVRTKDFGTDVVIIQDGFLRTKVFEGELFKRYREELDRAIAAQYKRNRRKIFIVGVAKHSKVLQTYRLAMSLEGVLHTSYASYTEVPRVLETNVYEYSEYARDDDAAAQGGEVNKFVGGKMFFVKFGNSPYDPIWPIDILQSQSDQASAILGYLLNDALDGFPVPFYPQSLQRAHENAALVGFDMEILQDEVVNALRELLGADSQVVDEARLQVADFSERRYG